MSNYRAISLLCSFSKVVEIVFKNQLTSFTYHKVTSTQHCVREQRGTETAHSQCYKEIVSRLGKGNYVIGRSLDFFRALIWLITVYFWRNWSKRFSLKQKVPVVSHYHSDLCKITQNVPQRSALFQCHLYDVESLLNRDAIIRTQQT